MSKGKGEGGQDRAFTVLDRFESGIACKCCAANQGLVVRRGRKAAAVQGASGNQRNEGNPGRARRAAAAS